MGLTLVDHPARAIQVQCHPLHSASSDAVALLDWLPHFRKGPYLFSTTFGEKPVNGFSKAKARLDEFMLEELGPGPGDQPTELAPFVIHDLRRTVRTRLSSLRVPDIVAKMVIGHCRRGLARVYDQHRFVDEMREAIELWAARLRSIVVPAGYVEL
jgi:integrase